MHYWRLLTIASLLALAGCSTVHHGYDKMVPHRYHADAKSVPAAKGLDQNKVDSSYQVSPLADPQQVKPASVTPPGSQLPPQTDKSSEY